jgi:hypothetical protein
VKFLSRVIIKLVGVNYVGDEVRVAQLNKSQITSAKKIRGEREEILGENIMRNGIGTKTPPRTVPCVSC